MAGMSEEHTWHPATIQEVQRIVQEDLNRCAPEEVAAFRKYAVPLHPAPLVRHSKMESVVVVARKGDKVIYWEDIDEGFNISPVGPDGTILEHWCNQDDLSLAIRKWV